MVPYNIESSKMAYQSESSEKESPPAALDVFSKDELARVRKSIKKNSKLFNDILNLQNSS